MLARTHCIATGGATVVCCAFSRKINVRCLDCPVALHECHHKDSRRYGWWSTHPAQLKMLDFSRNPTVSSTRAQQILCHCEQQIFAHTTALDKALAFCSFPNCHFHSLESKHMASRFPVWAANNFPLHCILFQEVFDQLIVLVYTRLLFIPAPIEKYQHAQVRWIWVNSSEKYSVLLMEALCHTPLRSPRWSKLHRMSFHLVAAILSGFTRQAICHWR